MDDANELPSEQIDWNAYQEDCRRRAMRHEERRGKVKAHTRRHLRGIRRVNRETHNSRHGHTPPPAQHSKAY